jgi:DNA-binding SARP family transcriptional activator/tetratricopeptide (TPR) repeat protein
MEIRLCGRFALEHHGESLEDKLPGRQVRLLLAYLALAGGRARSRDELIEALWPHRAPADPDAALRTLLSRLRAALPEGALEGRRELSLRFGAGDRLDVEEAHRALDRARSAAAQGEWGTAEASASSALEVARAPLLPGHGDAPWLDGWRRRLEELAAEALELLATAAVRREGGDLAAAEAAARELVEREPYRESAYARLMEVHVARGNRAEALRVYEQLRTLLRDELGTPPGAGVKALHEQLLREEEAVPVAEHSQARGRPRQAPRAASGYERTPLPALIARLGDQALVGREAEFQRLAGCWREAIEGRHHRILLLSGEPGVGKTSLAASFAREAHANGARVLYGRAEVDALIPYQPFVEALRQLALDDSLATLRAAAPELVELSRLVPEFRRRLPELPPPGEQTAGDDRYRLFSAATALLVEAASRCPLLLVLDDLQWADRSSLRLLGHIARHCDPAALLILGTHRDTDLHRSPELAAAISDLRRDQLVERIPLMGLDVEAVGKLIARATDAAPGGLSEVLWRETRGNPFFLVEMLRQLADDDPLWTEGQVPDAAQLLRRVGVPEGVREVIERRLAGLGERAQEALTLAAVLGQEFEFEALAAVAECTPGELEGPLQQALDAGFLAEFEERPGRLCFSHALVRETLYRRPSSIRRTLLHRRAGEALEALSFEDPEANAAELAHHFLAAGGRRDVDKGIRYSVTAAEQATTRLAYDEAAAHYTRAIEWAKRGVGRLDEGRRCELLLALGEARWRAGELEKAREACFRAAELAEKQGDPVKLARAALGFGGPLRLEVDPAVTRPIAELLERALVALGGEESALRARVMGRLAAALAYSRVEERKPELARQALAMARRVRDKEALADVLATGYWAVRGPDNLEECLAETQELSRLAIEAGEGRLAAWAHHMLSADLLELGHIEESKRELAALERLAGSLGQRYPKWLLAAARARCAHLEGRLEDCERLANDGLVLALEGYDESAAQAFGAQILMVRREQGRLEEVVEAIQAFAGGYPELAVWRCTLAWVYAELDWRREARQEFEALARSNFRDLPRDGVWLMCMSELALVAAFLGDARRAEALYERLLPYAGRCSVVLSALCEGSVSRILGLLATTTSRFGEATRHFEDALEMNSRIGSALWVAHTRREYAQMLLVRRGPGDCEKASELLAQALATAEELGLEGLAIKSRPLTSAAAAP